MILRIMRPMGTIILLNRQLARFFAVLVFASPCIVWGQSALTNPEIDTKVLAPGTRTTREIAGGQLHRYEIVLTQDQLAKVVVKQLGIDVGLRVIGPDGVTVAEASFDSSREGTEAATMAAESTGPHSLEIFPIAVKSGSGSYSIELSDLRPATSNEKELYKAFKDYFRARKLDAAGNAAEGLYAAKSSLEIRERILGPLDKDVAYSLLVVGSIYITQNDIAQAEPTIRRALDLIEKSIGAGSTAYADGAYALSRAVFNRGDFKAAETLLLQALRIREKTAGPISMPVATTLNLLGLTYRALTDFTKAEQAFRKGMEICEKTVGDDHTETFRMLNNLGLTYYGAGDYLNAGTALSRSVQIGEKLFGESRQLGLALNNLGLVEWKKGEYMKAEAAWLRALAIFEKIIGPESEGVANVSGNLGIIYKEYYRDYAKAEGYYKRSLAIIEKVSGEFSQPAGVANASLAILYRGMGDYSRAEERALRALTIYDKVVGPTHQNTVLALSVMFQLSAIKGDIASSMEYQKRIEAIDSANIQLNVINGSERQKIAFFSRLRNTDRNVTFLVNLAPENAESRDLVVTQILQRKGRILDAIAQNILGFRRRATPEDEVLLRKLSSLSSDISRFSTEHRKTLTNQEFDARRQEMLSERDKIEAEISRRTLGSYEPSKAVTLAEVQAVVPDDTALIEYAVYRPYDWGHKEGAEPYGEPRYIVFVIRKNGKVQWRELGAAKDIDDAIASLRAALRDPKRSDVQRLARYVDQKVAEPVRALTGDAKQLLISPDGELNMLPFEALIDESNRYLIQSHSINYVTSGRDLLRMKVKRESKEAPLVIANPDFDEAGDPFDTERKSAGRNTNRPGTTTKRKFSDSYFAPLSGTAREANSIKDLFPDATIFTGTGATETLLKKAEAPKILHIATHGFFLRDDAPAASTATPAPNIDNPLLRSGLAFAGANRRGDGSDDGILTALEASGLNLWGTKLVVLSACDTGVGEVRNGEGVYGLRRAFQIAGAESLVMSLWPISDLVTRELMTGYYTNLKQGMGRGESLRRIQLEMLKRPNRRHPFYWASFIQSGEWANLDGKR